MPLPDAAHAGRRHKLAPLRQLVGHPHLPHAGWSIANSTTAASIFGATRFFDHTRTKARSPQTNGICERVHKSILNEFYRVAFRKKIYTSLDELQADLDAWLTESGGCSEPDRSTLSLYGHIEDLASLDDVTRTSQQRFIVIGMLCIVNGEPSFWPHTNQHIPEHAPLVFDPSVA